MPQIVSDEFWLDSPEILVRSDRFLEFFITEDMTFVEKLNAITRLGIYVSVILALYHNNPKFLALSLVTITLVLFIRNFFDESSFSPNVPKNYTENFEDIREKILPTIDNPFMNAVITKPDDTIPSESYSKTPEAEKVREDIEANFSKNLFQDVGDVFETNNSRRQYYTVPRNSGDLKEFLYGGMKSGKEDQYSNGLVLYEPLQTLTER
jgi:hypothetical protein